jgi:hypothetical protein
VKSEKLLCCPILVSHARGRRRGAQAASLQHSAAAAECLFTQFNLRRKSVRGRAAANCGLAACAPQTKSQLPEFYSAVALGVGVGKANVGWINGGEVGDGVSLKNGVGVGETEGDIVGLGVGVGVGVGVGSGGTVLTQ